MGYVALFGFVFAVLLITAIASILVALWPLIIILAGTFLAGYIGIQIYAAIYFNSEKFKRTKGSLEQFTNNCNELNRHIEELKSAYVNVRTYDYGAGSLVDDSQFKYKRLSWTEELKNKHVHNCSASVCKNASNQPFKYLCKYFDIKVTEESLTDFESVLNDFAAAEQGKKLLEEERNRLVSKASESVPYLITAFCKKRLIRELGFEDVDLSDLYFPVYTFQYVSAGGRSSLRADIKLDVSNLDRLVLYLKDLVTFRKSIEGQRALMTSALREKIKARDGFTCRTCGISTADEKNLLLEIDHIVPLSRGGITSEENLQALCWRCNRSKGSKVISADLASK